MNPLASTKCAARLLMALAAVSGLFLTAGCSSSNKVSTNSEGFTNASLTGTYVFSSTGVDSTNGVFLAAAGSFVTDGNGNVLTGGNIDINSLSFGQSSTPISAASAAYSVGSDGRGQITLTTSGGVLPGIVLDFVLTSPSHGLVTEFDGDGTGSGTIDLQATGALTGSYSFGLSGAAVSGSNEVPLAMVGTFSTSVSRAQGISFNGLADINANGVATADLNLAATVTAGSPGTATLSSYNSSNDLVATYNFDVYMVDVTHLKFIETDTAQILAGDAFTQQTSIPDGVYAYSMEGLDSTSNVEPLAMAGFFTSASGTLSDVLQDYNDAGNFNEVAGTGGSFTTVTGGRTELTLNSIYNGASGLLDSPTFAAYPSSGGIEMLEIDNPTDGEFGITGGIALPQGTTTTISTTPGYGLNLSAINGNGGNGNFEEDDIAQFVVDSSGNYSGPEDINDEGSTTPNVSFTGTLTPDTAVAGHGSVTNSSEFNFNYYAANDGSTILILETDSNQLGLGSFEAQSSSGSGVRTAAAHTQFSPVLFKPKGKGAWKKRSK
jgi:hypothetical protein